MAPEKPLQLPSSYRDPSGFVFSYQGEIYRQVNKSFQKDFEQFVQSGLYQSLTEQQLLITHEVVPENLTGDDNWFATLKPEKIEFISYPYEWTFSMLKDAALLTLHLALRALDYGMVLKDASPYNIQFHKGQMTFIDTLSFERYYEGEPWIAYRQFCENFIGPLALMHYVGLPLQQLFLAHPEGVPLLLVKKLLPLKSKLNLYLYLHVHLHANVSTNARSKERKVTLSKRRMVSLLKSLQALVSSFQFNKFENVWGHYYEEAETRPRYLEEKKTIVAQWLSKIDVSSVLDAGGNTGEFSRIASTQNRRVICADGEHYAVEKLYSQSKQKNISDIQPVCIDFTNPSPALGVNNEERPSFFQRATSELVLALAFVHHLAIGKNVSFGLQAKMFAQLSRRYLIIEFVAKEDEKVKLLVRHKKDVYDWYTEEAFNKAFSAHFELIEKRSLTSSPRTLYLMKRL